MATSIPSPMNHFIRKLLATSLFAALAAPVTSAQTNVTLPGHVPPRVLTATRLARVAPDEPIRLSLAVRLDEQLLNETLDQLYGSHAPANKRFLTSAEFAQKFDLLAKREQLKQFAQAHGMTVNAAEDRPDSMVVNVLGNAGTIEQTFGVQLNRYRDATGQVFRAHEGDPVIPAAIQTHLSAIYGLSDIQGVFHHGLHAGPVAPTSVSDALSGSAPGGGFAPSDIKALYGLPTSVTAGAGQTVAVFELAQFNPADLAAYSSQFNLPNVPLTVINLDGFTSTCPPGGCIGLGTDEVDLDIELIAGVAPGLSRILVYDGVNSLQGGLDIYNQIAADNLAQVASTSWTLNETAAGSSMLLAENQIFQRMAVQGQTMFAASGDNGAYTPGNGATVGDPAAQPFVTAVGGTSLSGTLQAPLESAWGGSGGGFSSFWPLPGYQAGLPGAASQQFRNVPDVALNADPNSPYGTYVDGTWLNFGGTSASAPLWAGFTAIVNQQRLASAMPLLGFANPTLYQFAASSQYDNLYRDITSGNNGIYFAAAGYDNVTGWGSYRGMALLNAMSQAKVSISIYSPTVGQYLVTPVTISGSASGPAFASYRVEYGAGANPTVFNLIGSVHTSPVTVGVLETWNTSGLPSGIYSIRLTITDTSNQTTSAIVSPLYIDNSPPTAPAQVNLVAQGATTLVLSWSASTDDLGVAGYRVDLSSSTQFSSYAPGYRDFDAHAVTTLTINSLTPGITYFARVRAYDGSGNVSPNSPVAQAATFALPPVPGAAVFDPILLAPACRPTGSICDSGVLLNGRGTLARGAEPNQPNTLFNSCADGPSGTYHVDESNDHLMVSTLDGKPFAPGKTVRVDATVWANQNFGADWLDLYYAPNANSPVWTRIGTIRPTVAGAQVLSITYTLPNGSLQAVRANFRYGGRPNACTTGGYDDHDDLAFSVGAAAPPLAPVITSPSTASATVGSVFSYPITASNSPTSFNATSLPAGLTINTATGLISGIPASTGAFDVALTASNAEGTGSASLTLTISAASPPGAPVATFTVTQPAGSTPLTVTCDASGSTGGNLSYAWNFGDHSIGFGAVVNHTYTQPGAYAITVTVSNSLGSDHTRNLVSVSGN